MFVREAYSNSGRMYLLGAVTPEVKRLAVQDTEGYLIARPNEVANRQSILEGFLLENAYLCMRPSSRRTNKDRRHDLFDNEFSIEIKENAVLFWHAKSIDERFFHLGVDAVNRNSSDFFLFGHYVQQDDKVCFTGWTDKTELLTRNIRYPGERQDPLNLRSFLYKKQEYDGRNNSLKRLQDFPPFRGWLC